MQTFNLQIKTISSISAENILSLEAPSLHQAAALSNYLRIGPGVLKLNQHCLRLEQESEDQF